MTEQHRYFNWPQLVKGAQPRIWFGGDYNFDQWSEDVWEEIMAYMVKACIDTVSLEKFSWTKLEPEDGTSDFARLAKVIDRLGCSGIAVDLSTSAASLSMWLTQTRSELLLKHDRGYVCWPGAHQPWKPVSPVYHQRYSLKRCSALATYCKGNSTVMVSYGDNEYGCHNRFNLSDVARNFFQFWCRHRYGTIENLNKVCGTAFWSQELNDFTQIIPPSFIGKGNCTNPSRLVDFKWFSSDALKTLYKEECEALVEITPDKLLGTNFMVSTSNMTLNYEDWDYQVDLVFNVHYFSSGEAPLNGLAYLGSPISRVVCHHPWLLMEQSTSVVNWRTINEREDPGQLISDLSLHLVMGAGGICFFQRRQSQDGDEKLHLSMITHKGVGTELFRDACELSQDLHVLADEGLLDVGEAKSPVALVFDYQSQWVTGHSATLLQNFCFWSQYLDRFRVLDVVVTSVGVIPVRGDWDTYEVVVLFSLYILDVDDSRRVHVYVAAGGKTIVTYHIGISDQKDHIWLGVCLGSIRDEVGVRSEESVLMSDGNDVALNHLILSRGAGVHDIADYITSIDDTTHVLVTSIGDDPCFGMIGIPDISINSFRKCRSVFVGCLLEWRNLVCSLPELCKAMDIAVPDSVESGGLLRFERPNRKANQAFVFYFNWTRDKVAAQVEGRPSSGPMLRLILSWEQEPLSSTGW